MVRKPREKNDTERHRRALQMQVKERNDTVGFGFPRSEGSQVRILPRAHNSSSDRVAGGLHRAAGAPMGHKWSKLAQYRVALVALVASIVTLTAVVPAVIFGAGMHDPATVFTGLGVLGAGWAAFVATAFAEARLHTRNARPPRRDDSLA